MVINPTPANNGTPKTHKFVFKSVFLLIFPFITPPLPVIGGSLGDPSRINQRSKKKPFKFFTLRLCDCGSQRLPHNQSKHLPHLVFVAMSSCSGGSCQRQLNALTTVNVTFSYPVNDTKVELRNQTGMKLNLGFSCDSWPAVTAVRTVPPRPNKTRPTCSCFLVPLLCLFFSPFFSFLFFFSSKKASH